MEELLPLGITSAAVIRPSASMWHQRDVTTQQLPRVQLDELRDVLEEPLRNGEDAIENKNRVLHSSNGFVLRRSGRIRLQ